MQRFSILLTFLLAILFPVLVKSNYLLHLAVMALIFILLVSGLNLITGYVGLLSLGHVAFFGLGAYTSSLLSLKLNISYWLGLPVILLISALVGLLIGAVCLRLRGHFFVIVTLAFGTILKLLALNWVEVTNGPMGLIGIKAPSIDFGFWHFQFGSKASFYYLGLVLVVFVLYLINQLVHSRFGLAWIAIRENEHLAKSVGINVTKYALIALVIGASIAGIAGSFWAHYMSYVSPEIMDFSYMSMILVMLIIGGIGTVYGPVVGSILFVGMQEYLRIAEGFREPIIGLLLVLIVICMPKGILPAMKQVYSLIAEKLSLTKTCQSKGEKA